MISAISAVFHPDPQSKALNFLLSKLRLMPFVDIS